MRLHVLDTFQSDGCRRDIIAQLAPEALKLGYFPIGSATIEQLQHAITPHNIRFDCRTQQTIFTKDVVDKQDDVNAEDVSVVSMVSLTE